MLSINHLTNKLNDKVFSAIYNHSLVYNTCWENPAVDREVLNIGSDENMLVITSAGCNVLDYALQGPNKIHAVDANPRQTALLELKIAGIRELDFEDYFKVFGEGEHSRFWELYYDSLRHNLSEFSQDYWDNNGKWFQLGNSHKGFYYRGLTGRFAKAFQVYLSMNSALKESIEELMESTEIERQRQIYDDQIQQHLWSNKMNWILSRQFTMNILGVPHPQRKEVENQHTNGVAAFIRDAIEFVFRQIPISTNYFWTVYLRGRYTKSCCPEYLRKDNFFALKGGLVEHISTHTSTISQFLKTTNESISRYVLLDHMDWMSSYSPQALQEEWQYIFLRAAENTRLIFRSAHAKPNYLNNINVEPTDESSSITERLIFHPGLAADMQKKDRVHTYGGFHIADLIHV